MPTFRSTRPVQYSADQMFDLVADVERYPEFVPLCEELRILRRIAGEDGTEMLVASMRVGYKAINEAFTSRVTLDRENRQILVEYVDGPFKFLENRWTFRPKPNGSDIEFYIRYEFKSVILGRLMGSVFDRAFRRFSQAFEERAKSVYGAIPAQA
jgi:coenzyme Q-binding protein COQ10